MPAAAVPCGVEVRDSGSAAPLPLWGLGCAAFALGAVLVELISSAWANSPVPAWAEVLAPITWPRAARTVWWLAVAAAVAGFHLAAWRVGQRRRPVVVAATVLPFVGFAAAVAAGADWATWH